MTSFSQRIWSPSNPGRFRQTLGAAGFNILAANGKAAQQSVFHTHFHVIPRSPGDGLDLWSHGQSLVKLSHREAYEKLTGPKHPFA
jgi:diadenosine tetraphosphate (Ap4A) HIT family hydrolase